MERFFLLNILSSYDVHNSNIIVCWNYISCLGHHPRQKIMFSSSHRAVFYRTSSERFVSQTIVTIIFRDHLNTKINCENTKHESLIFIQKVMPTIVQLRVESTILVSISAKFQLQIVKYSEYNINSGGYDLWSASRNYWDGVIIRPGVL